MGMGAEMMWDSLFDWYDGVADDYDYDYDPCYPNSKSNKRLRKAIYKNLTRRKPVWRTNNRHIRLKKMTDSHLTMVRNWLIEKGFTKCEKIIAAEINRRMLNEFEDVT